MSHAVTVTFTNQWRGQAQIVKTTTNGGTVAGWHFTVKNSSGTVIGNYVTDSTGIITLDLEPGTYTVTETDGAKQYWENDPNPTRTVTVKAGETAKVTFKNQYKGAAQIIKTTTNGGTVAGWHFTVKNSSGTVIGNYVTDSTGIITLDLEPGTYTVTETDGAKQYWENDPNPTRTVTVKAGETAKVTFKNQYRGAAQIIKAMKNVLNAPFVRDMCNITEIMYRLGWDERNGGNISYLLDEKQVGEYLDLSIVIRTIPLGFDATAIVGKIFIVTGTGKYFRNVYADPENNLGIVRIAEDGQTAELLWGYKDGGKFTSEFPAHLMSHMARLSVDPENRVVMHCHPTHTLAMNYIHELDEKKFTHTLWEMCTECIVVFPDGVGVLPWMLCGTNSIGEATAEKMKEFRLVVWGMHGIYGAGKTMDETFGLIETVEKAAQIYMLTAHLPRINTIRDEQMVELAEFFGVNYRKDFLNL